MTPEQQLLASRLTHLKIVGAEVAKLLQQATEGLAAAQQIIEKLEEAYGLVDGAE